MADLTVDNFIMKMKDMQPCEHLCVEDLVKLIIQLPDTPPANNCDEVMNYINEMMITLTQVQKIALQNTQEIMNLKDENSKLNKINAELALDCRKLTNECNTLKTQIEGIDTYLRVNNIEISGLVDPGVDSVTNEPESVEKVILECINGLNPLQPLTPADIDICHELPNRKGGKTHVVRFVNRKTKNIIMEAKTERNNRQYTFRDKTIYINEHLTPNNKHLFALAKQKKIAANYKYLWTSSYSQGR